MKKISARFLLFTVLVLLSCCNQDVDSENSTNIAEYGQILAICKKVFINYYEIDSLQKGLVYPPKIYFDFIIVNNTSDSLLIVNSNLFSTDYPNENNFWALIGNDTINLYTNRHYEEKLFVPPHDSVYYYSETSPSDIRKCFDEDRYSNYKSFMEKIASDAELIFFFAKDSLGSMESKKVKKTILRDQNFKIEFRDKRDNRSPMW